MMNVEAWDAPGALPPATLPDHLISASAAFEAHAELVARINALESNLKQFFAPCIGHNGPPSPIDGIQFTAAQVAAILHETEKLRQQHPAPTAVPEEVQEAREALGRIFAEAFAQRAGERAADTLADLAKLGGRAAACYLLFRVLEAADLWVEAIKLAAGR